MDDQPTHDPAQIAAQIGWVRRLAHGLVDDPHLADDLAQETWLAFLRARPDASRPLEPWFARVLRNFARRARRGAARRTAREESAARAEAVDSSADVYERASLHRELVAAVLELEEPYRGTLLLRYVDDLKPREIARRQVVPVRTVNTRLRRGLARLRERLDRDHRHDRERWLGGLTAFASEHASRQAAALPWIVGLGCLLVGASLWALAAARGAFERAASAVAVPTASTRDAGGLEAPAPTSSRSAASTRAASALPPERTWWGRVLDPSGEPIAGASVSLSAPPRARLGRFDPPLEIGSTLLASGSTDARGRFRLAARCAGSKLLEAGASGRGGARLELALPPEEELVLRLPRAARLSGRVLDASGAPAGRALLQLRAQGGAACVLHTADDGTWRDAPIAPGRVEIQAFDAVHGAHGAVELELAAGEERSLDLILAQTARVSGRVVGARDRRPLEGVSVRLGHADGACAVSDGRGEFELAAPAALARLQLWFQVEGYALERVVLDPVPTGGATLEVALAAGRSAQGCVVDVDGAPLVGAWVAAVADEWRDGAHVFDRVTGRTLSDGCFQLTGLRREVAHTLLVCHPDRAPASIPFPRAERDLEHVDLGTLRLARGSTLRARVVDELGEPRARVELVLFQLGPRGTTSASVDPSLWAAGRAYARAESDADGRCTFEDLPEGSWYLVAGADASHERAALELDLALAESVARELVVPRGATLRGRLLDADRRPVAGATLVATAVAERSRMRGARSGENGWFELAGLLPGEQDLAITPPPGGDLAAERVVLTAPAEALELSLAPAETLHGRVLDADGTPLAFASVTGRDELGLALEQVWSDAQGRFEIRAPRARALELTARRSQAIGPHERAARGEVVARLALARERAASVELRCAP